MRKDFHLYKRTLTSGKKYYVKFWDYETQSYNSYFSIISLKEKLGKKAFHIPHTSKTGAEAIIRLWLQEGSVTGSRDSFLEYLSSFWQEDSEYIKSKRLRGQSISTEYASNNNIAIQKYVIPFLNKSKKQNISITQVKPELLEKLITHLSDTTELSHRRINAIFQAATVPLSEAERLGRINNNPAKKVRKLVEKKAVHQILTPDEVNQFFSLPQTNDLRYFAINLLAATTGMRLGECRGLLHEDVHEGWINVRHNWQDLEGLKTPKWGSERKVPLPVKTYNVLKDLSESNPWGNDFVFYGYKKDIPLGSTMISNNYKSDLEKIGIPNDERKKRKLSFHAWRHFYNSMLRGHLPDHALRMMTGHKSEKMTDRYSSITDEQRTAVAKLAEDII